MSAAVSLTMSPGESLGLDLDDTGRPHRPVLVVDADDPGWSSDAALTALAAELPVRVVVADTTPVPARLADLADVVICRPGLAEGAVDSDDPRATAEDFAQLVAGSAAASLTLAWLLRSRAYESVPAGLSAESAAYSALLGGQRFRDWLETRGTPRPPDGPGRVRWSLDGDLLRITLARAPRRNAVDTHMRQALVEALQPARLDPRIRVEIDADGPSFSAGGDLDEFGTATDLATAHVVRVGAGAGQLLHDLRDRVTVRVHGACVGAGIELPAFAGRIVAAPDSLFLLPEVSMGLIPGAGGTVSTPRRIGRGRAFYFGVTARPLDATSALAWGLVDEIA